MKRNIIFLLILACILNSCLIKSLNPFYINESITYTEDIIGEWIDEENSTWKIQSLKTSHLNAISINPKSESLVSKGTIETKTENDEDTSYIIENGYAIEFIEKERTASFVAILFTIEDEYFLDFIPFTDYDMNINKLMQQHLIVTHSLAKIEIQKNKKLRISWLSEEKLKELFDSKKLRLKHEKIGVQEDLLITASSNELYGFIKKYINSNVEDKWKTSNIFNLTK